ncbi:bifunctional YncE family protein/alkaline phosphatase family protein [Maribellus maritimus]|uniref:bifunctional YncE family protein/alkaline phosphatase family protein n=1 Tax=Maribellus maritimus TaxID=2870838 RepID=UPI001EEBE248|nr:YncE family protein [Maribellus maritimus]MCG6187969.1 bifunctional YncE family protein/alkaline phosphatase family protein [Maribellus maritimus]
MKRFLWFFIILIVAQPSLISQAQNKREKKQQTKHLSEYENQTLADSLLPLPMPYNRWVDPAGKQVYFGDKQLENHALDCALSPDGKYVAVEGRYSIVIISTGTNEIIERTTLENLLGDDDAINTFSGITWGKTGYDYSLYWSAAGDEKSYVIKASWNGRKLKKEKTFDFGANEPASTALPNEVVVTEENGKTMLYVVLNGNNMLVKLDEKTGQTIWSVETGVAPYGVVKAAGKIYVTNWAGAVPDENDKNIAGIPWGNAKVDPLTGATREGTVSVFSPADGRLIKDIIVGLHPNDIIPSPDENYVYVANANSDAVSVIDTKQDIVSESISVRLGDEKNPYWGDSPNGLGISGDGKILYVANGMDNAVALIELGKNASSSSNGNQSKISGFIPTSAYPGAVCVLRDQTLYIPNIEAEGARIPSISESGAKSYNAHRQMASVSIIPLPDKNQLADYTKRVHETNQIFRIALSKKLPRKNANAVPVPLRIGEPSIFKHVVYIIKENRTYDQILGDVSAGDGDPSLCVFGKEVTPNTHKIVDDFLLLDNFYVSGKSSAEGHQWTDMAIVTDYIEKNVRGWFRSYPHVQQDALVYAPTGFIWDNAIRHGKSVRIYGEACVPEFDKSATWESIYKQFKNGEKVEFKNTTTIDPVWDILSQNYPGYDSHKFPDVFRAQTFIKELKEYERKEGDQWPELIIIALPNDHTSGTRPGFPTPRAMVADNDLALGQIMEAISKSKFWKNTAVFITEDDSQAGWDHVSAYRTVGMVASPYTRFEKTNHTNYNQVSMIRTIEQILGLPPMNIMDATAMPMFNCFNSSADYSPYVSVPNQIPLDEMNSELSELKGPALHYAKKSMEPQFERVDAGDDELFNRIIWFAMKGKKPYPEKYSGKDEDDDDDD